MLRTVVCFLTGEKATVRQQTASVAGRKDNLMDVVMAALVLEGTVLGVIHKAELHRRCSIDIGM